MRKAFIALTVATTLILPVSAFAEDSSSSGNTSTSSPSATTRPQEKRKEEAEAFRKTQTEARTAAMDRLKEARTEWEQKKTELKANLQKVRDERKVKVVENLNDKIAERNSNWVEHWNNVLKRLTDILDKIEKRTTEAETNGKNVGTVRTAITTARAAITSAQAKIDAQAGKVYTITVSSEATLGSSVSTVVQQFHSDVKAVIESLNVARRSIQDVFKALKALIGDGTSPAPTATSTATPTALPTATP